MGFTSCATSVILLVRLSDNQTCIMLDRSWGGCQVRMASQLGLTHLAGDFAIRRERDTAPAPGAGINDAESGRAVFPTLAAGV